MVAAVQPCCRHSHHTLCSETTRADMASRTQHRTAGSHLGACHASSRCRPEAFIPACHHCHWVQDLLGVDARLQSASQYATNACGQKLVGCNKVRCWCPSMLLEQPDGPSALDHASEWIRSAGR